MQLMKKKYASIMDVDRFVNDIKRRCDSHGIGVDFHDFPTASCTRKTINLPRIPLPITKAEFKKLRANVVHETGHHLRLECFDVLDSVKIDPKGPLGAIFNMLEDAVQEREIAKRYRGDAKALNEGHALFMEEELAGLKECSKEFRSDPALCKAYAAFAVSRAANSDWNYGANLKLRKTLDLVPSSTELFEQLQKEGWVDAVRNGGDSWHVWRIAKALHRRLYGEDVPPPPPPPQGEGEGEGDGKAKRRPKDAGEDIGKGAPTKAEDEGASVEMEPANGPEKDRKYPWQNLINHEHQDGGTPSGASVDWSGKDRDGDWGLAPPDRLREIDIVKDCTIGAPTRVTEIDRDIALIANKARQLIQATQRTAWRTDLKRGHINYSALYRRRLPRVGNGDWNRRVFRKKTQAPEINTAISVLVDWSGSMHNSKKKYAIMATLAMNEVFSRVIKVPVEVGMFSYYGSASAHGIAKPFNERTISAETLAARMEAFDAYTSGNADAEAVMWAAKRLLRRREQRRLLIVLSDGSPTESYDPVYDGYVGDADAALRAILADLKANTDLEIHGIGICDSNVTRFYGKNAQVIKKPQDIPRCLIETIKNVVI